VAEPLSRRADDFRGMESSQIVAPATRINGTVTRGGP
jgi:hypothetical protein